MSPRHLILLVFVLVLISDNGPICGCLITNCPRGGKRGGKHAQPEIAIKPCVSCGPGRSGQCFGPSICCGPFGCLMGTAETAICRREGFFLESEPCVAGNASCRKNTGRCAYEGVCCGQDFCYTDKSCVYEEKIARTSIDFYNLINYQNPDLVLDK